MIQARLKSVIYYNTANEIGWTHRLTRMWVQSALFTIAMAADGQ